MKKFSPLVKGLITAAVMIIVASVLHYAKAPASSGLQYLSYFLYAGGIAWTLIAYSKSAEYTGKFGDIFQQGFKCFVVVTLVMTAYIGIFTKLNPQMATEYADAYKKYMIENEKHRTPQEIDELAAKSKNGFTTTYVSSAIFSYLLIGSIFTLAGAGFLMIRKKQ